MKRLVAGAALTATVLGACSSGGSNSEADREKCPQGALCPDPSLRQNVCNLIPHESWEGFGFFNASSAPGSCTYVGDDPRTSVRVSVRSRAGGSNASGPSTAETVVRVHGLKAPAVWVTASLGGTSSPDHPATTASTAPGTEDRVAGRLVVAPPGKLVVVNVSGQFNNSAMAEGVAKVVLDRL